MPPVTIPVQPAGAARYDVHVEPGAIARLGDVLDAHAIGARRIVASTAPIWRLLQPRLPASFRAAEPILLPDGERFKGLASVSRAYDALVKAGADRATTLVAVGGGVLGDTAGFAAATFLRGIPLVQVPTTLLAQVDSAIGGKVGVNHPLGKNLIGAFHQPRAVVIDPLVLDTLPRREFRAGLYEVVKYAMIADPALFVRLETRLAAIFARDADVLVPTIADCCAIKARIVTADERESGERRVLNFGHTAGHAFEAITRYRRFRHGEAVGYGMLAAASLAVARGAMPNDDRDRLARLIAQMGPLPPISDLSAREALQATRRDKKVVQGRLHFVLPHGVGTVTVVDDVTERELGAALRETGLRE